MKRSTSVIGHIKLPITKYFDTKQQIQWSPFLSDYHITGPSMTLVISPCPCWPVLSQERHSWLIEGLKLVVCPLHSPCLSPANKRLNYIKSWEILRYRPTSLCQTCLPRIHSICWSDHPFPSISPILLCISKLFMSNLVITKSLLYQSGFSFSKISLPLLYHYLCHSKFCVGQKIKQYGCQTE